MKKSTLIMILSLIMAVAVGMGSTVAYLQDTDEDVNVMTLGKVYITQNEQERVDATELPTEDNLKEFSQEKPLYPAVFEGDSIPWDADSEADQAWKVIQYNENAVDKFVTVTNTGTADAYVRTLIAFEGGEAYGPEGDYIHTVSNGSNVKDEKGEDVIRMELVGVATIDEVEYTVYEYTYLKALAPKATTIPSLKQVYMNHAATNDVIEKYGDQYDILVLSQAVQTKGFADPDAALNAAFGDTTVEKVQDWFANIGENVGTPGDKWPDNNPPFFPGDDVKAEYEVPADAYRVTNSAELKAAVAAGETTLLLAAGEYDIDGCGGKTLTLIGEDEDKTVLTVVGAGRGEANGQLDYGFDSSTVTFQNLTIKTNNATYAGYARLNGTYKNVNFDQCYCLNGNSVFENCTFDVTGNQYNLWTWGAPVATFTNCTFNSDGKAILLYGQANTKLTLDLCLFNDTGVLPDLKAAVEIGNDYNKSYELIVNDTVVNGYEINDNGINTGTTLWGNKNSMPQDKLNVVVDGVDVY